jgi:hypothetical protein
MFAGAPSNVILPREFVEALATAAHDWISGEPPRDGSAYVVDTGTHGVIKAYWVQRKDYAGRWERVDDAGGPAFPIKPMRWSVS